MKRCAKCGREYDDAYDGCPRCSNRGCFYYYLRFNQVALVVAIVAVLVFVLWFSVR
jgi:hypothetical protein